MIGDICSRSVRCPYEEMMPAGRPRTEEPGMFAPTLGSNLNPGFRPTLSVDYSARFAELSPS
jgi:hypothetical protein